MKINISRTHFSNALKSAAIVASASQTMPVLKNVLLKTVGNNAVSLMCTNLDLFIQCAIPAEVLEQGSILVPAKHVAAIVAELPNETITIEALKTTAKITCGNARFNVLTMDPSEMPKPDAISGGNTYHLTQEALSSTLRRIAHAQSKDEQRYVLNGVYLSFANESATGVATDGRRMAIVDTSLAKPAANPSAFIVPSAAVRQLLSFLGNGTAVSITSNDKKVIFEIDTDKCDEGAFHGSVRITSKVVEGNFPKYDAVIPKETKGYQPINLTRATFSEIVHRTSLVCTEKSRALTIGVDANRMTFNARSSELGEAKETLDIDYKGAEAKLSINPNYLLEPLAVLTDDDIEFRVKDDSPAILTTRTGYREAIMHIREN